MQGFVIRAQISNTIIMLELNVFDLEIILNSTCSVPKPISATVEEPWASVTCASVRFRF
jgi:hypothetical protein